MGTTSKGTLHRFFFGLTEHAFCCRMGIADPPLTDYVAGLLVRFVRCDAMYRVRDLVGRRLDEVAEMLLEAENRVGVARREVHRHVGDVALFWTGVYPEALPKLRSTSRKDYFVDYCSQGKRSYLIASTIPADEDAPRPEVLRRLSEQFELCVYGLGEVRREWERRDPDGEITGPIMLN